MSGVYARKRKMVDEIVQVHLPRRRAHGETTLANTERTIQRTIQRWLFERLDIPQLMGSMYNLLLARPVAATVCLIAVLAFSAYESHEVLEFVLAVSRVLATLAVASRLGIVGRRAALEEAC